MSAKQVPGQMSFTGIDIRDALDRIEAGYPDDDQWVRRLRAIEDAKLIRSLSERLIAEQVAEARSVENESHRVRLDKTVEDGSGSDRLSLVGHGRARDKRMYGWDVIGWVLGISGEAARQRYGL